MSNKGDGMNPHGFSWKVNPEFTRLGMIPSLLSGHRLLLSLGLALALFFAVCQAFFPESLRYLDDWVYDTLLEHYPDNRHSPDIVIADIDEKSLKKYGQWPWPRDQVALLFDRITDMGAAVTGVDMIFAEADRTSPSVVLREIGPSCAALLDDRRFTELLKDRDQILARSLARGSFVLGTQFHFNPSIESSFPCFLHPVKTAVLNQSGGDERTAIFESCGVLCNLPLLSRSSGMSGFNNFNPDPDGKLRRVPLVIAYEKEIHASLALAMVLEHKEADRLLLKKEKGVLKAIQIKDLTIPVDQRGQLLVKFRNSHTGYPYIPAVDIMEGHVPRQRLKGKMVFVGTTAVGLKEQRSTPFDPLCPGIDVHATVVDNILTSDFISAPPWGTALTVLLALTICMGQTFVIAYRSPGAGVLFLMGFTVGLALVVRQFFYLKGVFVGVAFPMVCVFIHFILMTGFKRRLETNRSRNALRESETRFRTLFRKAQVPMAQIALSGEILDVNDSMMEALGYTLDDVPTVEQARELFFVDPETKRGVQNAWVENIERSGSQAAAMESMEYPVRCRDGRIKTMIIGMKRLENTMIVNFFDITERRQAEAEREKLRQQLFQSKKLEAIGLLAGGVAHDYNNALGVIMGYAELAIFKTEASDSHRRFFTIILDTARRSANLTRQLLAFARKQDIVPVDLDLNESIKGILKMVRRLIGEHINLTWTPFEGACWVTMDPTQFDQILINLCVNARDAMKGEGNIAVKTGVTAVDTEFCAIHEEFAPGGYVFLSVSDDGCGMDQETLGRIFEPFFTTKEVGQGTGMGLATVYGIVKQNNGVITVDSDPGQGTVFTIHFPQADGKGKPSENDRTGDVYPGHGERVLLVEDEPVFREMASMMLKKLGYSVINAATPGASPSAGGGSFHRDRPSDYRCDSSRNERAASRR